MADRNAGLGSLEQEGYPCPSPAAALGGGAGPVPYLNSTVELTLVVGTGLSWLEGMGIRALSLPFVCCVVTWEREKWFPPFPGPLPPRQAGELAQVAIRVGELTMFLTSCNTWENRP